MAALPDPQVLQELQVHLVLVVGLQDRQVMMDWQALPALQVWMVLTATLALRAMTV